MKSHGKEFIGSLIVKSAGSVPSSGAEGELFYNTGDGSLYVADGSTFSAVGGEASSLIRRYDPHGDGIIHVVCTAQTIINYQLHGATPTARVTAYDLILSVYGGVGTITYYISKDAGMSWSSNTDPKQAYVEWSDGTISFLSVLVKVVNSDTPAKESKVDTFVIIQDNYGLTGA